MKIAVTGATGRVGKPLVEMLEERGDVEGDGAAQDRRLGQRRLQQVDIAHPVLEADHRDLLGRVAADLLRRLRRLSIHPSGRPLRNLQQILPHSIARDVMSQRREAEFRFASSFRCYLFKFRFHGQLIFSLNRRPCLPLNGAHVAQEQFNYR